MKVKLNYVKNSKGQKCCYLVMADDKMKCSCYQRRWMTSKTTSKTEKINQYRVIQEMYISYITTV